MGPKKKSVLKAENADLLSMLESARDALEETLEQIDDVLGIEENEEEREGSEAGRT